MSHKKKRNSNTLGTKIGNVVPSVKNIYHSDVGRRARKRAGNNKNIHGHINEILTCDKINRNPMSIIKRKKAVLTKSPIAQRDDIVIKQGKKVVGRMQLKDTRSASGIGKTIKTVEKGQYKGTNLVGTKETKAAYDKAVAAKNAKGANITQKMKSNGISSAQTQVIAAQTRGGNIFKYKDAIKSQAQKSGQKAAIISAGITGISEIKKVHNGQETCTKAALNVAKEGVIGGASAVVSDAVGTATTVGLVPVIGPAASVVGVAAGTATGIATDKAARKFGKTLGKVDYKKAKKVFTNQKKKLSPQSKKTSWGRAVPSHK